jgi:hypothetical protein
MQWQVQGASNYGSSGLCERTPEDPSARESGETPMSKLHACFLLLIGLTVSLSAQSGTLVVQLVEPGWLPVPNIAVRLVPVSSCNAGARGTSAAVTKDTDRSGNATFAVPGRTQYRVEVMKQGGFAAKRTCIRLFEFVPSLSTAYVQLRLSPAGPPVVIR